MREVKIISELCGQFGGSQRRAEQMILQSKMGGADYVKVQLYDTYKMSGENRDLWEYLDIDEEMLARLSSFACNMNIGMFASAFQKDKYDLIKKSQAWPINKIASSLLIDNMSLCKEIVADGITTLCSLGKWKDKEYPFKDDNVIYMHCVCEYPHTYERAIELMPAKFEGQLLGYSDHSVGIEACKEAIRRGAIWIEKHYTTDKELQCKTEGAHWCSMDYNELVELRNFGDKI